jgi:hypothetical protein
MMKPVNLLEKWVGAVLKTAPTTEHDLMGSRGPPMDAVLVAAHAAELFNIKLGVCKIKMITQGGFYL